MEPRDGCIVAVDDEGAHSLGSHVDNPVECSDQEVVVDLKHDVVTGGGRKCGNPEGSSTRAQSLDERHGSEMIEEMCPKRCGDHLKESNRGHRAGRRAQHEVDRCTDANTSTADLGGDRRARSWQPRAGDAAELPREHSSVGGHLFGKLLGG